VPSFYNFRCAKVIIVWEFLALTEGKIFWAVWLFFADFAERPTEVPVKSFKKS
jgi:hypothetical protein